MPLTTYSDVIGSIVRFKSILAISALEGAAAPPQNNVKRMIVRGMRVIGIRESYV
jgi:hypothetical protein